MKSIVIIICLFFTGLSAFGLDESERLSSQDCECLERVYENEWKEAQSTMPENASAAYRYGTLNMIVEQQCPREVGERLGLDYVSSCIDSGDDSY